MERRGVLDDGGGRPVADQDALIHSAIHSWQDGLIDLTAANPLLSLEPGTTTTIEVSRPAAGDVFTRLRTGGTFTFRSLKPWPDAVDPDAVEPDAVEPGAPEPGAGDAGPPGAAAGLPAPAPYILDTSMDPDDLDAALHALMRRSDQLHTDLGRRPLYLAFGTLAWTGRDRLGYTSPLLLVPVRLVATEPRQPPMLEPADEDPFVNPALELKLARTGVPLPGLADPAEISLTGLLDAVREQVATRPGWQVSDGVILACLPAMPEPVYRDLADHRDQVMAHPAVRALAARGPAGTGPAPPPAAARLGSGPSAEVPPLLLAADSAQRACVAAALAGRSFTLDGPPGTGKSQTIANITGALLQAGKSVLLVSEKAAALDVVAGRLADAGLAGYLLELHSDKAARKQVAAVLGEALAAAPEPPPLDSDVARQRLIAYADAMHLLREPLGYSLHDVLAMIGRQRSVPAAPTTGLAPALLTTQVLADIRRTAMTLAGAWRPAAEGAAFPWRGVVERGSLDDQLYQAASALEALAGAVRANQTLADATGLTRPSDAQELARLLDHLLTWPEGMPDDWLTMDTLDAVEAASAQLAGALTAISARESQATQAAGVPWSSIPRPDQLPPVDTRALAALDPPGADVKSLTAQQLTALARDFAATGDLLGKWLTTLAGLADMLGVRTPVTFSDASDLLTLARLAGEPDRPSRAWLSVPGHRAASGAAKALYDAHRALAQAEAAAGSYFTMEAMRHDVRGLAGRFAHDHHRLGRLSGDFRSDRRTVATFTRQGVTLEAAQEHLGLAAAWQEAAEAVSATEARYAALLGPHYTGQTTDFARLGRALTHAAIAVRCARGQDLAQAARFIALEAAPNQVVTSIAAQARQGLADWQATLAPPPAIAPRPELLDGTITDAIGWLRAHAAPLRGATQFTRAVGDVVAKQLTFGQARQLVALREAADAAHEQLAVRDAVFADLCGQPYEGSSTDVMTLRQWLEWAKRLRTMISGGPGPLTAAQLDAAESAIATDRVGKAAGAWQAARDTLLRAFSPPRRRELAAGLDNYQSGDELLERMFNDTTGRDEWHAHQAARASLAAQGLAAAVEFCVTEGVKSSQVPHVIERALLQGWAEYQVRTDPALAPLRAMRPDAMIAESQQLDRALATVAADDIVRACHARRPRGDTAESAVIEEEAAKRQRHLPVRELMALAPRVIQAVKPCFLASPLAVSQHLPPGLRFDTVIFDEASQLGPAEAISSIYRAGSVILAGDQKQLPPAGAGDGGDQAGADVWRPAAREALARVGVLDLAKASGAFGSFALRWHYRSKHAALIAFSNAAFYAGHLAPLPGSSNGQDAGVELLHGAGTYLRATTRDNPEEAARVAQRVIHHCDSRPGLSLGVVTFSEAQADAIEAALASARQQRPDLDKFFTGDRLRGFFVKPVESVQGDERDVLIVSVGYGPDASGRLTSDFGPLGRQDGWRRLNVAITRARYRTEVVSSIRATDIPDSVTGEGLRHLRHYLAYVATRPHR
jgi:uncharacterized protein DUF4011/AAA domain-containing protein